MSGPEASAPPEGLAGGLLPWPDPVRAWARQRPEAFALIAPGLAWTWAELDARVEGVAGRLRGLGPSGRPLVVQAPTSPALVALVLGALRAGRPLVPVSTRWPDALVQGALGDVGLRLDLGDADVEALALPAEASAPAQPLLPDTAPALVVFTSGSTGRPKGAVLSRGALRWSAEGLVTALGLRPGDRWLLDLPLYHVGGLGVVLRCALAGATLALPAPGASPAEALTLPGLTHASLVSTQLVRLLGAGAPLPTLRAALLGGSAMPPSALAEASARGLLVSPSYGLTEMASTVTAVPLGSDPEALSTSGQTLSHRTLALSVGGEILVGGLTLFAGYLSGPDPLRDLDRPFGPDGLFATGDLGRLDTQGRLVVTGRRGLRFVSGGENVQPEAIEAALARVPGVQEAVVVPVPDAEFGHRPAAFVRLAEGVPLEAQALREALALLVPRFMIPVAFHPLPLEPGAVKPDRQALAARAAEAQKESGAPG